MRLISIGTSLHLSLSYFGDVCLRQIFLCIIEANEKYRLLHYISRSSRFRPLESHYNLFVNLHSCVSSTCVTERASRKSSSPKRHERITKSLSFSLPTAMVNIHTVKCICFITKTVTDFFLYLMFFFYHNCLLLFKICINII